MSKEGVFTFSNPGFTNPSGPSAASYQPPPQPNAFQQSSYPPTGPPPPYPGESSGQTPNFSSTNNFTHNTSSFSQSGNNFSQNTNTFSHTGNSYNHNGRNFAQTSNVVITTTNRPTHVSVTRRNAIQQRNRKIFCFIMVILTGVSVVITVAAVGAF